MNVIFTARAPLLEIFPLAEGCASIERAELAALAAHPDWQNFIRGLTPYEEIEYASVLQNQSDRFGVLVSRTGCGGVCRNFGLINESADDLLGKRPNESEE